MVSEEYETFIDRAHLVLSYLTELVHDFSIHGNLSEDDMLSRVGAFFGRTNGMMSATFHQEFASFLVHDQALDRFEYVDLALNPRIPLDQPITRLTQDIINQGGLVDPKVYHFYLMKIQTLYSTTLEMDHIRLQSSHTYLDVTEFFHTYRFCMRNILGSATLATPWNKEQIHAELTKLLNRFQILLEDL